MIMDKVGLQLYNVREELEQDFFGAIEAVAQIGYRWVEFPGMSPEKMEFLLSDTETVRAHLDAFGLKTASISIAADALDGIDCYIAAAKALDCRNIGVPIAFFDGKEDVLALAGALDTAGRKCHAAGIQLHYHNHFHEFADMDGSCPLDILLEHTAKEHLYLELDVFWAARGGKDPIEVYRQWQDRISLVHLKDAGAAARPLDLFSVIPKDTRLDGEVFVKYALNPACFVEIGNGILNIPEFVREMAASGKVENFIVEQDYTAIGAFESARISFASLSNRI